MAVLQKIRELLSPPEVENEEIVPASEAAYKILPLTIKELKEVWRLNQRCFKKGENYPRQTFSFLLSEPNTLSYRAVVIASEETVGFIFITLAEDGAGHITTLGVAPEHRRRSLARRMLLVAEEALRRRHINTICLEVRVSNTVAQNLYRALDFAVVQRLSKYYNNGEDGFLMVKSLFQ